MSVRQMPDVIPSGTPQFAGCGISSGGGGGGGGGSHFPDFSTDEFDTGVKWIDGKSIYCRVVSGVSTGSSNFNINVTDWDIDNIVDFFGFVVHQDIYRYDANKYTYTKSTNQQLSIYWSTSASSNDPCYVAIYYTKNA